MSRSTQTSATAAPNRQGWIIVALVLLTVAVYLPLLRCGFINYDDHEYVTENKMVQGGLNWDSIRWAFSTDYQRNWHPLTWLSHMIDCQLWGMRPLPHHMTNLLFHVLNTLLLFRVLKKLTGAIWRSAVVAALFALHPTHVESVAWISERKDVLSIFFGFLSCWFYVGYVKKTNLRALSYALALLCFALSLMSKGTLVTLPFVWLLLDYWPLGRISGNSVQMKNSPHRAGAAPGVGRLIMEKVPFFALSAGVSVVTWIVQTPAKMQASADAHARAYHAAIVIEGYARYLGKLIWPVNLSVIYPLPRNFNSLAVASLLLGLILITGLAIVWARKRPWFAVGWFWYLGTLVPVSGVVKVGTHFIADRFTYVSSIGIFVALIWGAVELAQRWHVSRRTLIVCLACTLAPLIILAQRQVAYWENSKTLFEHALAVTHDNYTAHFCLAGYELEQKNIPAAEREYQRAIEINPDCAEACYNYGNILRDRRQLDDAITYYQMALRSKPDYAEAHNNLGDVFLKQNKYSDAASEFKRVLDLNAASGPAHCNLARIYVDSGEVENALAHGEKALLLIPQDYNAHFTYGCALVLAGRGAQAVEQFRQSLRLNPNHFKTMNELAWILATDSDSKLRNGPEAIALAQRACQLTSNSVPAFLGTLDTAYAECGRLQEAIATAQTARDLFLKSGQTNFAELAERRIDLYRAGKPFRAE